MDSYSHIKYDEKLTKQGNDFREYIYMFETGMNQTLSLFMSFIFILTIISIHIVNIKQYLIFIFIHTSFILVCTIRYNNLSLSNNNFQEIYYDIGWRISGLLIPGIWNNNDNTNQASMERNAKMMLSKKEIEEMIYDSESNNKTKEKAKKKVMSTKTYLNLMMLKLKNSIASWREMNQMSLTSKQAATMKLRKRAKMQTITRRIFSTRRTSISIELFSTFMESIMTKPFRIWSSAQISCTRTKFCIPRISFRRRIWKTATSHPQGKET